jgi:hypothetical protein
MKQYEEMSLEIASKFASRMCDEYGETHGEYLFCMSIDDISHAIKLVTEKAIAAERNKVWTKEHWTEYEREIAAAERDACAKAAGIALLGVDRDLTKRVMNAIRARGRDAA